MIQTPAQKNRGEESFVSRDGLCLLSLDGDGAGGSSTLYVLKYIMDELNETRRVAGISSVKPCEVFDLIGATSTGGLIAIMLGRLEMDIDGCIAEYKELSERVFRDKSHQRDFTLDGKIDPQIDPERLESAVKTVLNHRGLPENSLLSDGKDRRCKVQVRFFVCSVSKKTVGITRLRSYKGRDVGGTASTIYEAALATSAMPTVFDIDEIGGQKSADGAIRTDNAVGEVEAEAIDIWCPDTGDLKPLVKCFLSIGTGDHGLNPASEDSFKFASINLVELNINTEKAADHFGKLVRELHSDSRFYRFNDQRSLPGTGSGEYITKSIIETTADDAAQKFHMRRCASNLAMKQSISFIEFA